MAGEGTGWAFGVLMLKTAHLLTALALFLASCSASSGQDVVQPAEAPRVLKEIPKSYHGEWTNEQKYCGHDGDDLDSRLFVGADYAGWFESQWDVDQVTKISGGIIISYKPNDSADLLAPSELRLSDDGLSIFGSLNREGKGLNKCPPQAYSSIEKSN